jgi:hypothetical protein
VKVYRVKKWSHILIEGFCRINQEYDHKHSKWTYGWKGNKNPEDRGKLPNKDYDPTVKPDEKPEYCKGHICEACLHDGTMCPNLLYGTVEKKLKKKFGKLVHKHYEKNQD